MQDENPANAPIFHIGYHKTATTWFQQAVWPAARSHDFVPRAIARLALLDDPGLSFSEKSAREKLEAAAEKGRPIIVCEENLSGYIHNGGLHGLMGPEAARRIHRIYPHAHIVIFIRNQPDMIRACYSQYVSGGGTHSPKRYLFPHRHTGGALRYSYKAPGFEFAHFEYDRLIAYYDSLFGRERVHVYLYEELGNADELLERLERDLGVEFIGEAIDRARRNSSLGAGALFFLRIVNLFTRQSVVDKTTLLDLPGWQVARHAAKRALSLAPASASGGKQILSSGIIEHIRNHYGASNRRLLDSRDLPLSEYDYPLEKEGRTPVAERDLTGGIRNVFATGAF